MFKLRVKDTQKQTSVETSERYLDVDFEILKGEKVVAERKLGFPLDTPEKEVKEALKKYLKTFESEEKQKETQEGIDKQDKNAENVIAKLKDFEL